jgi:DNA repair exonuclease SbcCD ATPase subunit
MKILLTVLGVLLAAGTSAADRQSSVNDLLGMFKPKPQPAETLPPESETGYLPSPLDELAERDVQNSKAAGQKTGAVAGGVAGWVLSKNRDSTTERVAITAAAVGAGSFVGGQIGEAVGKRAAARRHQYAKEYEFLESEIAASERAIAVREEELERTDQEIAQNESRIDELKSQESLTRRELEEAKQLKVELQQQQAENESLMADYDEKIAYLTHVLDSSKVEGDATEAEREKYEQRHAALTAKRTRLLAQYESLQTRNQQLADNLQDLEDATEA